MLVDLDESKFFRRRFIVKILIWSIIVLGLGGAAYYYYLSSTPEYQAKRVVEKYLRASMNSQLTYEYKRASVEDFINVLDYEIVSLFNKSKRNKTYEVSLEEYNNGGKSGDESYIEYWNKMNDFYKFLDYKLIEESQKKNVYESRNIYQSEDRYDNVVFVVSLELTNGIGMKVFKKAYFEVDNSLGEFRIHNIVLMN